MQNKIKVFENKQVRTLWNADEEEWYFSVVDVCNVLADSSSKDPGAYWRKLKQRLKNEGSEVVTNCHGLKMQASDGKMRETDCLDTKGVLRLVQSIPSPKAEPFKMWLAQVGSERLDEIADPEKAILRGADFYRAKGYTEGWINQRLQTIEMRKELTDEWKERGIEQEKDYAILTNEMTKAWSGLSVKEYKELKGLKKENLRDNMTNIELVLNMLAEVTTTAISKREQPDTFEESKTIAKRGGKVAKNARTDIEMEEKCIALIRKTFNEFFRDMGLDPREVDLICALHLDRPSHLHFHFEFYEKRPWLKNKRAAGYKYRSKGKVPIKAIDNMVERLTSYTIDDDLKNRSDEARSALYKWKDFSEALCRDVATKKMKELAEKIPPTASFQYGKKDMAMYRREIDGIVEAVAMVDEDVCAADSAFRAELMRKETALKSIMGKYYAKRMKDDGIFKEEMTNASEFFGLKHIRTIDRLEWDYRRRLGNIVLKKVKYIQENTYKYNRTKKRKANDKSIKRHIAERNSILRS